MQNHSMNLNERGLQLSRGMHARQILVCCRQTKVVRKINRFSFTLSPAFDCFKTDEQNMLSTA